jgi:hypothetical protein
MVPGRLSTLAIDARSRPSGLVSWARLSFILVLRWASIITLAEK